MSNDLLIETFRFGRLDLIYTLRELKNIDLKILFKNDIDYHIGWEWRLFHNLKLLVTIGERNLINNETEKFLPILDYLEKIIKNYEKKFNLTDRRLYSKSLNYFLVIVYCLLKEIKNKLNINEKSVIVLQKDFNKRFKNYLDIIKKKNFFLHNFSPFEENKWSSKWKFIYEEKEIILRNIDVYIDTYFYNPNIYYRNDMSNNLFFLASRLQYLKENTKKYYRSCISLRVYSLSERIFYQFPITNIFNNYRKLIALGEHVFIPELYRETKTDEFWLFSVLPRYLVAFLLGYPVITSGDFEVKNLKQSILNFIQDKQKYYKDYAENVIDPYIKIKSFGIDCGNGIDDENVIDLSYNNINQYNIDDITIYFSQGVNHIFTSPEYDNLLKKQINPYNRANITNLINIKENISFKSKLLRKLKNRGLEINLNATLKEIYEEIIEKISQEKDIIYQEEYNHLDFPFYLTNFLNSINS